MLSNLMLDLQDLTTEYGILALVRRYCYPNLWPCMTTYIRNIQIVNNVSIATNSIHGLTPSLTTPRLKPALGLTMSFLTDTTIWLTPARSIFPVNPNTDLDNREMESFSERTLGNVKRLGNIFIAEVLRSRSFVRSDIAWKVTLPDFVNCFLYYRRDTPVGHSDWMMMAFFMKPRSCLAAYPISFTVRRWHGEPPSQISKKQSHNVWFETNI